MIVKLLIHGKGNLEGLEGFYQVLHIEAADVPAAVASAREFTEVDGLEMDGLREDHTEVRTRDEIPEEMWMAEPVRVKSGIVIAKIGRIWHPRDE